MRIVVKNLTPGDRYAFQVRSKNASEVSEWSRTFRITAPKPTARPLPPEGVTLESIGDSFQASWEPVTMSTDGQPATDLAGYLVKFRNTKTDQEANFETTALTFELTFNLNIALFTPPAGSLGVRIAAKNSYGLVSDWSDEAIAQNPPPGPVRNLTAEGVLGAIVANWLPPEPMEDDFKEYRAFVGTDPNFDIEETAPFWTGVSTSATFYSENDMVDYYIKVVAVDKFESMSLESVAGPVRPRSSTRVDVDPPPVPGNISGEIEEHTLTVTWDAVANNDNDLAGYQVGYRPTGTTAWMTTSVSHEETAAVIQPITRYQDYDVRVRAHDFSFNYSHWSTIVKVDGEENVAPAVPTGLTVKGAITSAMVFWDANTEPDLAGYEVQFKADEAPTDDDPVFPTTGRTISFSENVTRDTNYYARVRAVDTAGLKSAWSAPAMGQVGFPPPPETSDGNPPSSSPKPVVTGGLDALYVSWPVIENHDTVTYEVHVSTNNNFTPVNGTKASELNGTATTIRTLPSGAALVVGTTYYVKTVAKDIDGPAAPSAQTSAALRKLTYPEVEPVLTDGNPPSSSPVATLRAGVGSIFAQWPAISNADPVTYEIHLGTSTGFTPGAATRVGETSSTFTTVQKLPNGNPLAVGTNYFVKIIAKDADGAASAGGASNGVSVEYVPTKGDIDDVNTRIDDTITGSVIQYAVNTSETTAPTTGWSTDTPTRTPGSFIWFRTVITYADGSGSTSNPALLTGPPGSQGTPAPVISLASEAQVLISPATGGATTPATTKVTGTAVNATISTWEYSVNGAAFTTTVPAGVSRSGNVVTITGSTMTARTIGVRASGNGVSDTVTVAKVSDGAEGAPGGTGGSGEDAITLLLTNESHTFPGSVTAALAGSATTSIIAYKGATRQNVTVGTITGQVTGLTTSVAGSGTNAPTITINVTTALTALNGVLTIPVTVDGKSFTKDVSWSVSRQGSQGIPGEKGDDGVQLYTWLKYADTPTSGMSDSPEGKTYVGMAYNKTSPDESENYADYSWSLIRGADGKGISNTVVDYAKSTNGTTAPTSGWGTSIPGTVAGEYLWTRTVTTYTDDTTSTAYAVARHGATGNPGAAGRGITGTTVTYAKNNSGTVQPISWQSTIPTTSPGEWLWTKTTTTYTSAPLSVDSFSVAKHGETGQQGIPGPPGADGTTTYTWVKYAPNGNPTAAQMSDLPTNMTHIGLAFNKTTATESNTPSDYSWSLIQGADGSDGVSITSITPFFRAVTKGAAKPAQPSGTGNPSGWTTTEPAFSMNTELYRTERILYSNNTASWTPVTKVAAYEGIDQVNTVAITADRRVRKADRAPQVADGAGAPAGALWYEYGPATAPGTGTVLKQTWEWNGTNTWSPRGIDRTFLPQVDIASGTFGDLIGDRIVARSITAAKIGANEITANEIKAKTITADEIAADTITANELEANIIKVGTTLIQDGAITTDFIAANAIKATHIDANAIEAQHIKAGAITTDKLTITPGNLFPDPYLNEESSWTGGLAGVGGDPEMPGGRRLSLQTLNVQAGSYFRGQNERYIPYEPGAKYRLRFMSRSGGTGPRSMRVFIRVETNDGSTLVRGFDVDLNPVRFQYGYVETEIEVPTTARPAGMMNLGFFTSPPYESGGSIYIGGIELVRKVSGVIIEDGTIGADKIKTEEIATDNAFITNLKVTTANITDLTFDKIEGGEGIITNLDVTSTLTIGSAFRTGAIQSYNYNPGGGGGFGTGTIGAGYRLDNNGIVINSGSISAAALNINVGNNLLPAAYADFEFHPDFYVSGINNSGTTCQVSGGRAGATPKFNSQLLTVVSTSTSTSYIRLCPGAGDYNVDVEAGKTYIVSGWFRGIGVGATTLGFRLRYNNSAAYSSLTYRSAPSSDGWVRMHEEFTIPSGQTAVQVLIYIGGPVGAGFDVDGIQFEEKTGNTDEPSSWSPPSSTTIDGGMIRTGEIRSTEMVYVGGTSSSHLQPAWSLNTIGGMQVGNALIRGTLTVGTTSDGTSYSTTSKVVSANYSTAGAGRGFLLRGSDGYAEFNKLKINLSASVDGSITVGATSGARTLIDYSGMTVYNSSNQPILDTTGGQITVAGNIKTGVSNTEGVHILPDSSKYGQGIIKFRATNLIDSRSPYVALERINTNNTLVVSGPTSVSGSLTRKSSISMYENGNMEIGGTGIGDFSFYAGTIIYSETGTNQIVANNIELKHPTYTMFDANVIMNGYNISGAWETYTPGWWSTSSVLIGNSQRIGRYKRIGNTVFVNITIIVGSTHNRGNGQYMFGLPFPAETAAGTQLLNANIVQAGSGDVLGIAKIEPEAPDRVLRVQLVNQPRAAVWNNNLGHDYPHSQGLSTGSKITITGAYEAQPNPGTSGTGGR